MLGAPEVISMNALLIKSLGGKKVLDVGVYTGASSLGAALALPDGKYNKHCEILVSCSDDERNCMQGQGTACKLM